MEELEKPRYFRFVAGSSEDPRPGDMPREKRFARCISCNKIIHWSLCFKAWVCDEGKYHSGHELEYPQP